MGSLVDAASLNPRAEFAVGWKFDHVLQFLKCSVAVPLTLFCNAYPAAKQALRRWGLRTNRYWLHRALTVQTPEGPTLQLGGRNYLIFKLFWKGTGYYKPITTWIIRELIGPNDTFIDVGANVGFHSLMLSCFRPWIKVIAFEPNPENFALLRDNVFMNDFTS